MSRIRSVHPGLFTDEAFVCLSDSAQIFFIGLWTECDDQGAFEWKPVQLRLKLRGNREGGVDTLLAELAEANCIRSYEHGGRKFGLVRNFQRFQRPKKPNSVHFIPPELRTFVSSADQSSEAVPHQFPTSGEKSPQMEDGGGRMEEEGGKEEREGARAQGEPVHRKVVKDILTTRTTDIDQWERDFLRSIERKDRLTKAQFDSFETIQAKLKANGEHPSALPSVRRGSPAYEAWIAYYRSRGPSSFYEKMDVLTVPSEFPPQEQAA